MITFSSAYSGIARLNDRARHDATLLVIEMLRLDGLFFINNKLNFNLGNFLSDFPSIPFFASINHNKSTRKRRYWKNRIWLEEQSCSAACHSRGTLIPFYLLVFFCFVKFV